MFKHAFMKYIMGQWPEAVADLKVILALYPEDGPSNFLLGQMTCQAQPKDEESEEWSSVLEKLKSSTKQQNEQEEEWREMIMESNKRLEEINEEQSIKQRAPQVRAVPAQWMGYR